MGKRRDEPDEPTLELPSFFRRRKRRPEDTAGTPTTDTQPVEAQPVERQPVEASAAHDVSAHDVPAEQTTPEETPREEVPRSAPETEPVRAAEPEPAPEPVHEPITPETAPPTDDAAPAEPTDDVGPTEPAPAPTGRRAARAARRTRGRPRVSAGAGSLVAGVVVGLVGTGLTWAALQGCEALRGTDSCGGPGLLVLVAILALMVVAGALLLRLLQVTEPNATSFLGVGLMTVIVLVALMESLFSVWMFLAVPVLTALSFLAAQWVSTRFVDTEKTAPGVDVR